ncbi:MAG: nickel pincer cofactor biosynthesis protein LarC [Deltaproteobacteria bacterium]|nr:nickel pincer cofactor biosynthesis protein LarC [Deltaproteobacteria bacterium]
MKTAYFDCFSGISGDMTLGALIDLGLNLNTLKKELKKLPLKNYKLSAKKGERHFIAGTNFTVNIGEAHNHRTYLDIKRMIEKSRLKLPVKDLSLKIFKTLAEAEAKVHNCKVENVHFHEVGAVDSIIDIVGTAIGINELGIEKVYSSPLPLGGGTIKTSHGIMPVPAPATIEILKGVPIQPSYVKGEIVTPTGAAIIKTLAHSFGEMPQMNILKTGYGVGDKDFKEVPNLLRVIMGKNNHPLIPPLKKVGRVGFFEHGVKGQEKKLIMLETNIDDMNPQIYEYVIERLFDARALDVFLTPIQMKKNRPAILLNCLCEEEQKDKLLEIIFKETTSIGIRAYPIERYCLDRNIQKVSTKYGRISVKVSKLNGEIVNIQPEYEDCQRIAKEKQAPLKEVWIEAIRIKKFKS